MIGVFNNYQEYISSFENGTVDSAFFGEWSALWVINNCKPEGSFYLWDSLDGMRSCLLKVEKNQQKWRITQGFELDKFIERIAGELGITADFETAMKWWNLCYFKDKEGRVHYDTDYDSLYVANYNEKTLREFRERLDECFQEKFPKIEELGSAPIYVCDDLMKYNPLVYKLQQNGCMVKPLPKVEINEETWGQFCELRKEHAAPYCEGETFGLHYYTADQDAMPVEYGRPYLMSLMCGQIQLEDKAIGNVTFKDILPNGALYTDYRSCGVEYMYLEATFYADLFGNTLMKTINSKEEPWPPVMINNKFEFNS